jgi:hypothetical protein
MDNKKIMEIAKKQSGLDYNFDEQLLDINGIHLLEPKEIGKHARNYLYNKKFYLNFVYYGTGLVCVANDKVKDFIRELVLKSPNELYRVFDAPQINEICAEVAKEGYEIDHLADFYLPDVNSNVSLNPNIKLEVLEGSEIDKLYEDKRFTMALSYTTTAQRKDVLAIVGYIDGEIAGVAGCSNDSELMWQIGIDVVEKYRYQSVASTLVHHISKETMKRGKVPFYCTAYSNIASRNVARNAGFKSAWVELSVLEK